MEDKQLFGKKKSGKMLKSPVLGIQPIWSLFLTDNNLLLLIGKGERGNAFIKKDPVCSLFNRP